MNDFNKIFKSREYHQLAGYKKRDLYILTLILFVTFFALAHIFGGQKELEARMSNPFTNWVNLPVSNTSGRNMPRLVEDLQSPRLIDSFEIESSKHYQINWLKGLKKSMPETKKMRLRSIDFNDPIMEIVNAKSNLIHISTKSHTSCHIIITEEALEELEYYEYSDSMALPVYDNEYDEYGLILLLPISHVVKELPNNVDIVVSSKMMSLLNSDVERTKFIDQSDSRNITFFSEKEYDKSTIENYLGDLIEISNIEYSKLNLNGKLYIDHKVSLYERFSFIKRLEIQSEMQRYQMFSYSDIFCNEDVEENIHEHYFALNFKNLSKIKEFRDFAKNEYDINISLAQIESKKNFYLISRLAQIFIYLLIGFSLFSIIVFLQSIIRNHLEKVKSTLGTLKAFGLKNDEIRDLYMSVVLKFFGIASLFSFFALFSYFVIIKIFSFTFFFDLLNLKILSIWCGSVIVLCLFFYRYIANILFKSPGDLIYNR